MSYRKNEGNILLSLAITGGTVLFVASFLNAGLKAFQQPKQGAVKGAYIAQARITQGPSPTPTTVPRVTQTPIPSPYFKFTIKNAQGITVDYKGGTICSTSWGGQVQQGRAATGRCEPSPKNGFTLPADQYRGLGAYTGIYVKPAVQGWAIKGITSNLPGMISVTNLSDDAGFRGYAYGWPVATFRKTGQTTIDLTIDPPTSLGYIKNAKNEFINITFYSGQPASTACGNVKLMKACSGAPIMSGSMVAQCTISGVVYPVYLGGSCPLVTLTPTKTPTPTVKPVATATKGPACYNCLFQPKGDANCNLAIDSEDYNYWKTKYLGGTVDSKINPDFNKDGKVNLVDLQIWVTGLNNPPAVPANACTTGVSPTVTNGPSPTITPTKTPVPTDIPEPTEIPEATNTPGPSPTAIPVSGQTYYIAPNGDDTNEGTLAAPFKTFKVAMAKLSPGDLLYVREGVYVENVTGVKKISGQANAKITVKNYQNERPVIQGLFWMSGMSYWVFDGINITWNSSLTSGDHMVKFTGEGTNWELKNCEIWGARSYAGISVTGFTKNWSINNCIIHDTYKSNDTNQDHLIYVNDSSYGTIERNIFVNSENGRGVKLGPPSGTGGPNHITIQYNTFYNNLGPANIQVSGTTADNLIWRNILIKPLAGRTNITTNSGYTGSNTVAKENLGFQSAGVFETGIVDGGGNVNNTIDPQINFNVTKRSDGSYILDVNSFKPANVQAQGYGKFAQ